MLNSGMFCRTMGSWLSRYAGFCKARGHLLIALQHVDHVHFHVIPKPNKEKGLLLTEKIWPRVEPPKEELAETLKKMHIRDLSNPEIAKMRPVVREAEACRVCGREDTAVKLEICTRCVQERRPQRALYCGQACQRKDWKERHKGEHSGELPWGIQDRATRECVRHTNGDYSVPLYSAGY